MRVSGRAWLVAASILMVGSLTAPGAEASPEAELERLGHNFRISRNSARQSQPAVAYNAVGNELLVVWADRRLEGTRGRDIFGQRVGTSGELLGSAFRISGHAAVANEYQPAVAHNPDGDEYLVVWADRRNEDRRGWDIYAQRMSSSGDRLGHNIRISGVHAKDDEWRPNVAYNSVDGQYAVVWMDARRPSAPETDVFGQIIDADGSRRGHNFRIASTAQTARDPFDEQFRQLGSPAIAHNPAVNEFFVAWPDRRDKEGCCGGSQYVYAQRLGASGDRLGAAVRINGKRFGVTLSTSLAYSALQNEYLVVWRGDEDNEYSTVFGRRVSVNGRRLGATFRVTDQEDPWHVFLPQIAYDAVHDHYLVTWAGLEGWSRSAIVGQVLAGTGEPVGSSFQVSGPQSFAFYPDVAIAANGTEGGYVVAWTDGRRRDRSFSDIYGQLFTG